MMSSRQSNRCFVSNPVSLDQLNSVYIVAVQVATAAEISLHRASHGAAHGFQALHRLRMRQEIKSRT